MPDDNLASMREIMIRMGESLRHLEENVKNPMPTFDASNKEVVKEISDEIRQNFFRKKDPAPQIIGSVMGVIALISAMTAIIQPMNKAIDSAHKEIDNIVADSDRDMQRMEERIKETYSDERHRAEAESAKGERDHNSHTVAIEKLRESDALDKPYNLKIDMMEKLLMDHLGE